MTSKRLLYQRDWNNNEKLFAGSSFAYFTAVAFFKFVKVSTKIRSTRFKGKIADINNEISSKICCQFLGSHGWKMNLLGEECDKCGVISTRFVTSSRSDIRERTRGQSVPLLSTWNALTILITLLRERLKRRKTGERLPVCEWFVACTPVSNLANWTITERKRNARDVRLIRS